jgi:hypothetical protein
MNEVENKSIDLEVGNVRVSVRLDKEGVEVDLIRTDNQIGFCPQDEILESASSSYLDFGLEVKEIKGD